MARNRFSLEELRHLQSVLVQHREVTPSNRGTLVETLRSIAELMIWGDQHEPRFFEFFLENQLLLHFHRILGTRNTDVQQQVLQTLSIMIQNIRSETSIYSLFSNNHINNMISLKLDFGNEEVLGYYISFLKAIALKFNEQTVQLFLVMDTDPKLPSAFPLYTEALSLFRNKESMVRAAARTISLSVFTIRDDLVRSFLLSPPAVNYFRHVAMYLTEQCQILDSVLANAEANSTSFRVATLDNVLAEVEDVMVYSNDVLSSACPRVSAVMASSLWQHFLVPCCFAPLARGIDADQYKDPSSVWMGEYQAATRPVCSLYVAERVFGLMTHERLVNSLACALLGVEPRKCDPSGAWATRDLIGPVVGKAYSSGAGAAGNAHGQPRIYRNAILAALKGSDCAVAGAAVRLLFAMLHSHALSMEVMDAGGLLPSRKRKRRDLFNSLTSDKKSLGDEMDQLEIGPSKANGQKSEAGIVSQSALEVLDALFMQLHTVALPASVLWYTGWILGQLVPEQQRGTQHSRFMTPEQRKLLDGARTMSREEVMDEISGLWCDALPILISAEWPAAKRGITAPALKSHSQAVLAWMTASTAQSMQKGRHHPQLSLSARAALRCMTAVQRLVALLQIRLLLETGEIPAAAPLPQAADASALVRRPDLREGAQVNLAGPGPGASPCRVAFSRGVERSVYFALNDGAISQGAGEDSEFWNLVPSVLLADPASAQPSTGTVLSTSPLLGADPSVDGSHPHWLHLHVRPPIRGLLKALKLGQQQQQWQAPQDGLAKLTGPGGASLLSGRHLQDGHWVLSFPSGQAASAAKTLVEERGAQFRAVYCQVLESMLWDMQHSAEVLEDSAAKS